MATLRCAPLCPAVPRLAHLALPPGIIGHAMPTAVLTSREEARHDPSTAYLPTVLRFGVGPRGLGLAHLAHLAGGTIMVPWPGRCGLRVRAAGPAAQAQP